jgi:excisionase family DNA binding protein
MMSTGTDIISVGQAARMLHADPPFVFALILRGELKSVGTGPEIRLSRSAVQAYLKTHPQDSFSRVARAFRERWIGAIDHA